MSSNVQDIVSKNAYGKHCTTKSLDELTFNRVFSTYEYAYVTAVRAETESNNLKNEPSVVTYDTVDCRTTKNIDSPKSKNNRI